MNAAVSRTAGLGLDGDRCIRVIPRHIQPNVIAVHCSRHRLDLAFKDTLKSTPTGEKVITLLSGLYYLYGKSPLNRTNLKNAYRCLGMKILLPTRAGGTRWLGHSLKALNVFLMGYPAIRMHLEQLAASNERGNSKTKAIGFLKLIKSRDIISMALFLQDILTVLQKVSMKFQEEGSVVAIDINNSYIPLVTQRDCVSYIPLGTTV